MGIQLTTGQRFSLKKQAPGLNALLCGLGWELMPQKGLKKIFKSDFDLDISILCLNEEGKLQKSSDVVYYGNLTHPSGAISHLGDNLTGEHTTPNATEKHEEEEEEEILDKEQILVTLPQVPKRVQKLLIVANIYESNHRRQNLGQVENAYIRLVDLEHEMEIARYDLSHDDFKDETGMILAEIYRQEDSQWQVEIIGKGVKVQSLQELAEQYS
ncbi:TerD family protein [Dactylococcopsis salina]|uniref:Stress response protein, TerZ-and CABP1 n=1 Tax=Dactylococcopsis salina (strain PCC 8305) TaxID=13035 RepID=K9YVP7_DACS8|nr:TerD family protein [Dactylococcopsis salina]AFZ50592.1 putative stress response protein, TerZ- and CABP1 [Dactylococcopsis salina PCC 8305]